MHNAQFHGMLPRESSSWPKGLRNPKPENTIPAKETDMASYYLREAGTISDDMHEQMLLKRHRLRKNRYAFYKALAEMCSQDPAFRCPHQHTSSVDLMQKGHYKEPVWEHSEVRSASDRLAKKHGESDTLLIGDAVVYTRRFWPLWQRLGDLDAWDSRLQQGWQDRLKDKRMPHGTIPDPLVQEALVRWLGIDECVVLFQSVFQVWSIPVRHKGTIGGGIATRLRAKWDDVSVWVSGVVSSREELMTLMGCHHRLVLRPGP